MESQQSWVKDYFEEIYSKPDPWKYFTSPYERTKYQRQQDILKDLLQIRIQYHVSSVKPTIPQ